MNVKVCNLRSRDFNEEFVNSIITTGFAVVTHHGIDYGLIRDTQAAWREFFNQKSGYKSQYINEQDANMGYKQFGKETAVGAIKPDLKEFYHFKPGQVLPVETASLTEKIYHLLEGHLSGQLLQVLDSVSPGTTYKRDCEGSTNTILRALYYPAFNDIKTEPGAVRGAAHEDIDFLTLLVAASSSGLQVKDNNGDWHNVPHEENSVIVNVGDQLQLASNRLFKSTTHRVVNPQDPNVDRISIPLFVHPFGNTLLAPGFTAQQFLNQRLSTIYQQEYKKD
jgi:isopenicillin N synthase-like dioxygenase